MHAASPPRPSRIAWPAGIPAPIRVDDEPLVLPDAPIPARRSAVPLLASVVPVAGAVALWLVTGSVFSLWFAALGPLIAAATVVDARRTARRDRRRGMREAVQARDRVRAEIDRRHTHERARRWAEHPDLAALIHDDARVWRATGEPDAIVVGRGDAPSGLRVAGGAGDDDAAAVRASAASVADAPITAALTAGIAVTGSPVLAAAVVRGLAMQACVLHPPGALRVIGSVAGDNAWSAGMPHRRSRTGLTLAIVAPGEVLPDADAVIARVDPGSSPPPRCAVSVGITSVRTARVTAPGMLADIVTEALGEAQAAQLTAHLMTRATSVFPAPAELAPVPLSALLGGEAVDVPDALTAVIGVCDDGPVRVDLVGDGPHAVVAGVTGAGKSELLITWITALCSTHTSLAVTFLLADFKGGTAFDALRELPHVTGVLTDLDGSGARRALESLRAEVRRREEELARVGARDVRDARVTLPRLVIVVDEFAALLHDHPELQQIFTDVAARGRALGMHLILGTQRVAGVVRDALLANCPLRISLRVTDPADSRAVIGTDEAARLPGGRTSRGSALVRRGSDAGAQLVRIALTDPGDIAAAALQASAEPEPWRPWLPELPRRVTVAELAHDEPLATGALVLGLRDEPDRQRQSLAVLSPVERGIAVIGMAGSGRTTALAAIARQVPDRLLRWIPRDPERAWDAIARLDQPPPAGCVVVIDDLDALLARYPFEHAHTVAAGIERLTRLAGDSGIRVVVSAQRLTGAVGRIVDLLPRRAVLGMASRADHVAVGADGAAWVANPPPGRAIIDAAAVQLAWTAAVPVIRDVDPAPPWTPRIGVSGVVTRRGAAARLSQLLGQRGAQVVGVEDAVSLVESARPFDSAVVVVADPDAWQRAWRVLGAVRAEHDLLIDAACAGDYRALTGDREPPPYCAPRPDRAWLLCAEEPPRRVRLPVQETAGIDPPLALDLGADGAVRSAYGHLDHRP